VGVIVVRLPHDLVDDELRVVVDVKQLDPRLDVNAQAIDVGLVLCHIVCCTEIQSSHIEESISLGDIITMPPPALLRVKELSKYMLQCSRVTGAGGYRVTVHYATKSTKAWNLIIVCGTYVMSSPMSLRPHMAILPMARQFPTFSPSPCEVTTRIGWLTKLCRSLCV
jgi:hypothetical protein